MPGQGLEEVQTRPITVSARLKIIGGDLVPPSAGGNGRRVQAPMHLLVLAKGNQNRRLIRFNLGLKGGP
jgi:hypothetical protein